ncbi:MAG: hypothetical protein HYU42_06385 [Candidatus Rokubacteria bacterium]|nr:hypothetical protein [Candidatus Rokubacteria bacterium]MBI3104684.1 hypothetical protein [Candidatus Rokubacteria bacterium]
MWGRVVNWRFGLLLGVMLLDAAAFAVPLVPLAMVVGAVVAPDALRGVARFLEALADGR